MMSCLSLRLAPLAPFREMGRCLWCRAVGWPFPRYVLILAGTCPTRSRSVRWFSSGWVGADILNPMHRYVLIEFPIQATSRFLLYTRRLQVWVRLPVGRPISCGGKSKF